MPKVTLGDVHRSVALRPVTGVYLAGVAVIMLIVHNLLSVTVGILIFGIAAVLILLATVYEELREVHVMVNGQHEALLERIAELHDALNAAGVPIPPEHHYEFGRHYQESRR